MFSAILAWGIALACIAAALRRLGALLAAGQRVAAVRRALATTGSPEPQESEAVLWVREVRSAPTRESQVALLNEELSDVARLTSVGAEVPKATGRIALFSGGALALFDLSQHLSGGSELLWAGAAFAAGLIGFLGCVEVGRRAKESSARLREAWNEVSRRIIPDTRTTSHPTTARVGYHG